MRAIAMYHHTPIDSLPVELLAHIFSLGTHHVRDSDDSDDSPPFTAESVKAPLIYGSVCRHWRAVTLRTAALYTSVCITPLLLRPSADGDVLDTIPISMYVARSRACPLDILIDARDPEWDAFADDGSYYIPPFSAGHMQTALRTLLPHLVRWRSLVVLTDLYIPMAAALRPLGAALATHGAPQLMDLRLLRCDAHAQAPDTDDVLFAGLAVDALGAPTPRLRNLQLVGVPAVWDTLPALLRPAFPSAPASLETLELSYLPHGTQPTLSQLARLLHAAPAMQRVVLRGSCLPSFSAFSLSPALAFSDAPAVFRLTSIVADDTADLEPPALPLLRALSLSCSSPPAALALLKLFGATPRLAEITLDDAEGAILPFGIDPSGTSGDAPLIATQAQAGGGAAAVLAGVLPGRPGAAALFPALARLTLRGALYPPTMAARDAEFIIGGTRMRTRCTPTTRSRTRMRGLCRRRSGRRGARWGWRRRWG
ncbi:hypothetical protein B0H15DRAFT_434380 [Mycena belliarum]|uniref:F-box domain-containing protein n=1 Tax=Mycena belliarum TaxID=1033014 RepID=A0AAD6U306_9AGAR|nr:hypothetical protein B0H15DRAFT_434380 [Mycena belliae]